MAARFDENLASNLYSKPRTSFPSHKPAHDSEAAEPITTCFAKLSSMRKHLIARCSHLFRRLLNDYAVSASLWSEISCTDIATWTINAVISRNCFIAFINFEVWSSNWRLLNVTYLCNQCLSGATRIRDFVRWRKKSEWSLTAALKAWNSTLEVGDSYKTI